MSWIRDVAGDLSALDSSSKALRKFGITVGLVFLLLGLAVLWRVGMTNLMLIFSTAGGLLVLSGLIMPTVLKPIYIPWMGFAFAAGWLVSRLILILVFFLVIFPVGLLARLAGKQFLDRDFKQKRETYWVRRDDTPLDYKKMH